MFQRVCASALARVAGISKFCLPAFAGKPCAVAGGHESRRDSALSISFSNALMSASHMFGPHVRTFLLAVVNRYTKKARVRKNARRQGSRALSLQYIGTNPGVGYAACRLAAACLPRSVTMS